MNEFRDAVNEIEDDVNVTMNQSELQAEFNRIKDNVTYTINADTWKDKFKV